MELLLRGSCALLDELSLGRSKLEVVVTKCFFWLGAGWFLVKENGLFDGFLVKKYPFSGRNSLHVKLLRGYNGFSVSLACLAEGSVL